MFQAYRIEVNIITIVLLFVLKIALKSSSSSFSADKVIFRHMLNLDLLFSFSDIGTVIFNGRPGSACFIALLIFKSIYVGVITVISFLWVRYIYIRVGKPLSRKDSFFWSLPLIASTALFAINPFIQIVFSIDANNVYHRGLGVYIHWVVGWFYILSGFIIVLKEYLKCSDYLKRKDLKPLLFFILFPATASIFQMLSFGLSTTQIGTALGILFIFCISICGEVSTDSLTKLNNRGGMNNFIFNMFENNRVQVLTVLLLDLNNFKSINDKLGHAVGDQALKDAAKILQTSASDVPDHFFCCRYGGDEFLFIGRNIYPGSDEILANAIRKNSQLKNSEQTANYKIEFSIGISKGNCSSYNDVKKLIEQADNKMYEDKQQLKMQSKVK